MLARLTQAARERGLSPCVMTFEPHPREFFTPEQAPARLSNLREKLELFERFGVERVFILRFNKRFAQVSAEDFISRTLYQGLQAHWVLVGDDFASAPNAPAISPCCSRPGSISVSRWRRWIA